MFCEQKSLFTAHGIRSRIMPVVGGNISEICKYLFLFSQILLDIKAEMLRRCYGNKAPEL